MQRTALLVITLITVGFAPLIEGGTTQLPVLILHLLVLSMLAAWLIDGYKNGRLTIHVSPIDIPALAFFAASLISSIIAPYKYMALIWVQLIFYYLLFLFLSREALFNATGTRYAVLTVLVMGAVESLWGLGERLYGIARPAGSFFNPDMLAGYLAPPCLLAVSLAIWGKAARRGYRALLLPIAALCLVTVILTGSRGGVLSLVAGALVVLWARYRWRGLALVAAAALLVLLVPNPVRDRVLGHGQDPFAYSRTGIWKSSVEMVRDHPMGVGAGNFKYFFTKYNFPVDGAVIRYGKTANTAHNEYLHAGAETGFLGLAIFIAGVLFLMKTLIRSVRETSGGEDAGLAVGLAGGITAIFVHSLVDANLHEPGIMFLLILLVSLLLSISGGASREIFLKGGGGPGRLALYAALISLLAVYACMPGAAYYFSSRAKAEARAGDMKSAMSDADSSLLIEPNNASYHSQKAALSFALFQRGGGREDFDGAVAGLEEAIRLNPNDVSYELLISRIEYGFAMTMPPSPERKKYLDRALGHAARAVELAPNSAEALLAEARAHIARGDARDAVTVLERLGTAEPDCLSGRLMLAVKYRELGKTELSRKEYYNIIERAKALNGASLSPEEREFVKLDPAALAGLGKELGVTN